MDINLNKILGSAGLPEELVTSLQEAFDRKVEEARQQAETNIRAEFATRYEHDKDHLVEAMDRMLGDVAQKHADTQAKEVAKLREARAKFRDARRTTINEHRILVAETAETSKKFVLENLRKEVAKLRESRKATMAERAKLSEAVQAAKAEVASRLTARVRKIDEFVTRQVNRELGEFAQDQKALVETRLKLVREGRAKLSEAQKRFVRESAKKVERVVSESLSREMKQLHGDLERNRENMFGRRIFEAVAAEYMTSYLNEGTEVSKLQQVVEGLKAEAAARKAKLDEAESRIEAASRKAKLAEDRASRTKIMSELLSNLRGEKRAVMEGMLETTKTEQLRASFDRLLPVVLNEGAAKKTATTAPGAKKVLSEQRNDRGAVMTGQQRVNPTHDTTREDAAAVEAEVAQLVRWAGIR